MTATQTGHGSHRWLDQAGHLEQALDAWRGIDQVALDTEFIRESTYWPRLALVQLAAADGILLIDMLAPGMCEALRPLLRDPGITKLMHSASEDLVALGHGCDAPPTPLYDTQIAAALAGLGASLSYQALVRELTGVELAKGETRSDWLRRPLSASQSEYAADDVRHLHALRRALDDRLGRLGRRDWLHQDCQRMLANAGNQIDPWPHLSMRNSHQLDAGSQKRLCALLRWRDRQAIESDKPKSWIVSNDLLVALARKPPSDLSAFQGFLDRQLKSPRKLRDPLWNALQTPIPESEAFPLAPVQDGAYKQRLRKLQDAVAKVAGRLDLPEPVLASRRHLETLLNQGHWPDALDGWRRELLEPELRPVLASVTTGD